MSENEEMEQHVFVQYKNTLIEGTSEKVNRALFQNKTFVILRIFYSLNPLFVFIIKIFAH